MNKDKIFRYFLISSGMIIVLVSLAIIITLFKGSLESIKQYGVGFIFSSEWNPREGHESYGALPFIIGTLLTSILALLITFPFSLSISLFLGEYFKTGRFASILKAIVELLAGIPSVVYGLWGFYAIKPLIAYLGLNPQGFGIFTASIVLSIMIIPYASSIGSEVISMVPKNLKEAAYSLGATRYEVIRDVILPNARSGIFAGYILAFGRALGETMAVTMLIGNSNKIPNSIFDLGNTMASIIANQFGEAEGIKYNSLIEIGLLLLLITGIINLAARLVMKKISV